MTGFYESGCVAHEHIYGIQAGAAGAFFLHALRGDHHNRVLFNPTRMPTPQEIDRHIDFVVHTFLRCCTAGGDKSL